MSAKIHLGKEDIAHLRDRTRRELCYCLLGMLSNCKDTRDNIICFIFHEEAEEIEKLAAEIVQQCPRFAESLCCQYFTLGTLREKAQRLSLSHTNFGSMLRWLRFAWQEKFLHSNVIEIPI